MLALHNASAVDGCRKGSSGRLPSKTPSFPSGNWFISIAEAHPGRAPIGAYGTVATSWESRSTRMTGNSVLGSRFA
jgi:hypothetical protein